MNEQVHESVPTNEQLMEAFMLGARCAEHAAERSEERSSALFQTLLEVARGQLTLIGSPEESAAQFGQLPANMIDMIRRSSTATRRREREIALQILQMPEEPDDE